MKKALPLILFSLAAFVALAWTAYEVADAIKAPKAIKPASATVIIRFPSGAHGSGVHLGNGVFLTAAHVVDDERGQMMVESSLGDALTGEVLWLNKGFDVALVKTNGVDQNLRTRAMSCAPLKPGHAIQAEGAPMDFGLSVTLGIVSQAAPAPLQDWAKAQMVDASFGPGMSGGPIVSREPETWGKVVGIVVGGNKYQLNLIVPAEVICPLLART